MTETWAQRTQRVHSLHDRFGRPEWIRSWDQKSSLVIEFRYRDLEAFEAYKAANTEHNPEVSQLSHKIFPDGHVEGVISVALDMPVTKHYT